MEDSVKVSNIHTRTLSISLEQAAPLIDSLASKNDMLWPKNDWPPMRFDRPLSVGATGGHGPIRYFVNDYEPGRFVCFTFSAPKGFDGIHAYRLERKSSGSCSLTHSIEMNTTGFALVNWTMVIRPLHDALIEDSLFLAELFAGVEKPSKSSWSPWVRILRSLLKKKRP